jgi:DNA-binding response OmpR family regulator
MDKLARDLATAVEYDLILLDVQVPKLDGISLCRQLRSPGYRKSILMLTGNYSDADVVALFDAGADDYISKPCTPEVLLARMRTLLRRSVALSAGGTAKHSSFTLTWGNLCLDMDSGRVTFGEQVISLTATEYNLLELLRRNPDRIFSRSAILDRLWGMDGFAVYEILQSDPITRSIPIILLTAKVLPSDQAKFAQMAVAGVITKPIQPLTLTEEVAEILGWVD